MTTLETTVYVVVGSTGEYSDHTYWFVRAFAHKSGAEWFAVAVNSWLEEHGYDKPQRGEYVGSITDNPYDPDCQVDYTGTKYYVEELPFDPMAA